MVFFVKFVDYRNSLFYYHRLKALALRTILDGGRSHERWLLFVESQQAVFTRAARQQRCAVHSRFTLGGD
jgi:hypothetical protein